MIAEMSATKKEHFAKLMRGLDPEQSNVSDSDNLILSHIDRQDRDNRYHDGQDDLWHRQGWCDREHEIVPREQAGASL